MYKGAKISIIRAMKKSKKKPQNKAKKGKGGPAARKGLSPMGDRVLVKPMSAEDAGQVTSFGIIIPDSAKEKPEQGKVVAVGPKSSLKVGDKVMFSTKNYEGDVFKEVTVGGVDYYILSESNILGVLN